MTSHFSENQLTANPAQQMVGILLLFLMVPWLGKSQDGGMREGEAQSRGTAFGSSGAVDSNYRMRSGDTVRVTVFGEPELTVEGRLDRVGQLQCALIGSVTLAQLTSKEAAQRIEAAYREDYLVRPEVTVEVLNFSRRTFTMLGQVTRPGAYDLPESGEINLLQALGMAGGTTRIARLSKVKITRRINGKEESLTVDVSRLLSGKEQQPFMLREGDVLTVPESWF
jgi:protein involved in polysaccharide export with SLBB domain